MSNSVPAKRGRDKGENRDANASFEEIGELAENIGQMLQPPPRKRRALEGSQRTTGGTRKIPKVPGQLLSVELENFMCHEHLRMDFDVTKYNCFYIVGPNGSGKSAIFAGINMALGGAGRANDRGKTVQSYVKEGENHARLRVTLTNEGEGSFPGIYGNSILVERTFNAQTNASTYSLKTSAGKLVSHKKSDLDTILTHFNIDLENPLSWLSQDRSRQFLSSMKSDKLYEIFMESTKISDTEQTYKKVEDYLSKMKNLLEKSERRSDQLKRDYKEKKVRYDYKSQLREKKLEHARLCLYQMWAPVRDFDIKVQDQRSKIERIADAKTKLLQSLEEATVEKAGLLSGNKEFEQVARTVAKKLEAQSAAASLLSREHIQHKTRLADLHKTAESKRVELNTLGRELQDTEQQLRKVIGDSNRDIGDEQRDLEDTGTRIDHDTAELEQRKNSANNEEKRCDAEWQEKRRETQHAEFELGQIYEQQNNLKREKTMLAQSQRNRLVLFGENVPKLLGLLKANAQRFKATPIGPIGNYISLKNPKWAAPVEYTLQKLFNSFICDSSQDRKALELLCRANNIQVPDLISTSFSTTKFDTSRNEPPRNYETILRVIDVADPTVYNTLIDQMNIENILIIEDDDEARVVMNQNPPANTKYAVTMTCSQAYPRTNRSPYRFYAQFPPFTPRVLCEQSTRNAKDFDNQIQALAAQAVQQKAALEEHKREEKEAEKLMNAAREAKNSLETRTRELKKQRDQLEEKRTELDKILLSGNLIDNFRASLRENRTTQERLENELAEIQTQIAETRKNYEEARGKLETSNKEKQALIKQNDENENESNNFQNSLQETNDKMTSIQQRLEKCDKMKEKAEEEIRNLENEKERKMDKLLADDQLTPPEGEDIPPDLEKIPESERLNSMVKRIESELRIAQKGGAPPTLEEMETLKQEFLKFKNRVDEFIVVYNRLNKLCDQRVHSFCMMKYQIPRTLTDQFLSNMRMRNYGATLEVDHSEGLINITVETHQQTHDDYSTLQPTPVHARGRRRLDSEDEPGPSTAARRKRIQQDLKGLSGGERSYTTACFVMSLWKCVESPFRLLDEFDVFMDMLNRRIVMGLFVDYAIQNSDNQFFFFTPQSIQELMRDDIQVFDLPKVRGAGIVDDGDEIMDE